MKNVFFILSIFCFSITFSQNQKDIGIVHNELIDDFLKEYADKSFKSVSEMLNSFYISTLETHPELKNDKLFDEFKSSFNSDLSTTSIFTHFNSRLDELEKNGKISNYLYGKFILIAKNPSVEEAQKIILDIEKNISLLTEDDKVCFNTFKSVLSASNTYWTNGNKKESHRALKKDPGAAAIVGDALGGALWWWTGPWAALIAGGYSLALYYA